jgi:DNA-binding transcriptional LysR family regulator
MKHEMLNDRALGYLHAVWEHGGVRAGADHLGLDPATLSRAVTRLEQELGTPLMERHGRGARPTEAGKLLLEHYRDMRSRREDTLARLEEVKGMGRGVIDITLGEGFIEDLHDGALSAFCRLYPGIVVNQHIAGSNDIIHKVGEDEAHVGLIYSPAPDARIVSRGAWRQPLCAMAPPGHPLLTEEGPVTLEEVARHPLGLLHGAFGVRQLVDMATARARLTLSPRLTSNSFGALKEFVIAGLGVAFMPAFAARRALAAGILRAVEVADELFLSAEAHIIVRRGRRLPASARALAECMALTMHAFGGAEGPCGLKP